MNSHKIWIASVKFSSIAVLFILLVTSNLASASEAAARNWAICSGYLSGAAGIMKEHLPRTTGNARNELIQVINHLGQNSQNMFANAGGEMMKAGMTDMNAIMSRLRPIVNQGNNSAVNHGASDPMTFITSGSQAQREIVRCLNMR